MRRSLVIPGIVLLLATSAHGQATRPVDFAHDILPILKAHCAKCHTNGTYKGSLSLDTRATLLKAKVVVPGKAAQSELLQRVSSTDPQMRMPPKGPALSEKEVALLRAWIDQGLPWQEGFTFKKEAYVAPLKPRRPELPPVREAREHPIDRILDAYYARLGQKLPPAVDDATFMRRLYLDLLGLLPTPAELDAFLVDTAPDKRDRLIGRVLSEDRVYAEHWLSFWNDLLRNDYAGTGYIDGGRKQISAWLYKALHENRPYDRFTRELISPTPDSEGFINGIKWRGNVNASQVRELQFAQNVAQVFFGVNLKCASCHDSFIDGWKLDDAYGMAGILADAPLEMHRCDKPLGRKATARFLWPELGTIDTKAPKAKRLEQLAALVTHPDNGRFTRTIANRLWQRLFGRGIVHPVDMMGTRPWSDDLLDHLAVYLADNKYDLKKLLEYIVRSRAYQSAHAVRKEEPAGEDYVFRGPEVKRLTAEQFLDAVWMLTHTAPAKPAAPVKLPEFEAATPAERRFTRAALMHADALMRSLGRPNREQVVTTRPDQLTTLQALDLANGAGLADTLARGAANLLKAEPKATPQERIESLYRRALCRKPTPAELEAARAVLGDKPTPEALADLLWVVFSLPEFQLIR